MLRCDKQITRRTALQVGALGAAGVGLADLLRLEAAETAATKGRNAIVVFLTGGQSHIDTWDMKPEAGEMRGEFNSIDTNVPGFRICEHMPHLAKQADKYAVIRSVSHTQGAHSPGQRYLQTGNRKIPSLEYPDYGAVIAKEHAAPKGVPPYVLLPGGGSNSATYSSGYLGVAYGPFSALGDPNANGYSVRALATPDGSSLSALEARRKLLTRVDRAFADVDTRNAELIGMNKAYEQAFDILRSERVRKAFKIDSESAELRERYGRTTFGQQCLLARRLVEAGTRCVSIYTGGWDTHSDNFTDLKNELLPPWDQGLAALIEDLDQRGLLENTVVWCTGEFGRTPKINDMGAGRDHWARAMSMLFAGCGIRGGKVIGETDKTASEPTSDPYSPDDAAASF
ncbi:MAG: DUF1501 domain-containing protein, partial [Pirellulaceae bacterium]|nr:DUF1501 domain-containing protein [Pirellulaceae bacterium]